MSFSVHKRFLNTSLTMGDMIMVVVTLLISGVFFTVIDFGDKRNDRTNYAKGFVKILSDAGHSWEWVDPNATNIVILPMKFFDIKSNGISIGRLEVDEPQKVTLYVLNSKNNTVGYYNKVSKQTRRLDGTVVGDGDLRMSLIPDPYR